MLLHPIANRSRFHSHNGLLKRRNVRRRQRRRTAQNIFENPLAALNGRSAVGIRSHQQHAALSQEASPGIARNCYAAEVRTVDSRNAIVPSETFVDER